MAVPGSAANELLNAFRAHYRRYESAVREVVANSTDTVVLWRLGDDLEQFRGLVVEHGGIFDPNERELILQNVADMQHDIRRLYQEALDESHYGYPTVVQTVHTGGRGRPAIVIDPDFLRWAYSLRSTTSIAHFLGVSRWTVRGALLQYGIAAPQEQPSTLAAANWPSYVSYDDEEDLNSADHAAINANEAPGGPVISSYTGPVSTMTDDELDDLLTRLRWHYQRAGQRMLDGMLRRLGHNVPRERLTQALLRVDPVRRVFQRITIRRRTYNVPGPNALWHHDGQHGLIRWGIVIHGFIDGYSRLITGLHASDNNRGETVLRLFEEAAGQYGVPMRLRGDHGVENLQVAAYMEGFRGEGRGAYIWGRSVHNIRIERLWADVTAQVSAAWADAFMLLELQQGFDINNANHIWLLQYLFLHRLNAQLRFFAEAWNQHRIEIRNGPNRSPADMFGFDMHVHGIRGTDPMTEEQLELFGVDWDALHDNALLESRQVNNEENEDVTSWIRGGPPERLNEVLVESPAAPFSDIHLQMFDAAMAQVPENACVADRWEAGLLAARLLRPDLF